MERNRKQKLLTIFVLVFCIASLSIGFAAFSVSLNISSSASVSPNSDTFSVKFSTEKDSLVVDAVTPSSNAYNLNTTNGVINNATNPTLSNLSVTFTEPGQVVVYRIYARNEGEYTAYLNSINFIGNKTCTAAAGTTNALVQSACEDINVHAIIGGNLYDETTSIIGHALEKNTGEEILIVLEYVGSGERADGAFNIIFQDISFIYSTIDDSSMPPTITKLVNLKSGDLNTPGSIVSIGEEQFYVIGQDNGNVKLFAMYNLLVGNTYDGESGAVPLTNPTGIQDEIAQGYRYSEESNDDSYPWIGTTAFTEIDDIVHIKPDNPITYEGSIVEGYVNSYKSYLEGIGVNIIEARLLLYDEVIALGCGDTNCSNEKPWLYSTSYWLGTTLLNYAWSMHKNFDYMESECSNDFVFGVRPVIIISEEEFQ